MTMTMEQMLEKMAQINNQEEAYVKNKTEMALRIIHEIKTGNYYQTIPQLGAEFKKNQDAVIILTFLCKDTNESVADLAKGIFYESMKRYVSDIIYNRFPTYVPKYLDEMMQSGAIAIIKNLPDYDPLKSRPTTFFEAPILHEILNFINSYVYHMTQHYASYMRKVNKAAEQLQRENKEITKEAISNLTGLSIGAVSQIMDMTKTEVDFDESYITEELASPEEVFIKNEEKDMLYQLIDLLPETEQKLIYMRYALNGEICDPDNRKKKDETQAFRQIAKKLGLTYDEALRLNQSALQSLASMITKTSQGLAKYEKSSIVEQTEIQVIPTELYDIAYRDMEDMETDLAW